MEKDLAPSVGPLSQAAVASFVFGIFQVTLTGGYYIIRLIFLTSLKESGFPFPENLFTTPSTIDSNMFLIICLVNIWGLLGLVTGIFAVRSTRRGKSGDALGVVGILASVLSLGIVFTPIIASLFGVSLQLF